MDDLTKDCRPPTWHGIKKSFKQSFAFLRWAPRYSRQDAIGDLIAGTTVGLMVLPQGLAYAQLAGLPKEYGLYSSFMCVFVYCFFGTSKDISLGPTALLCLLISHAATNDPVKGCALCVMVGIIQLAMSFLKLGALVELISQPVIHGFTSAAAIAIVVPQLSGVLAVKTRRDFIGCMIDVFKQIGSWQYTDILVGVTGFITILSLKKFQEKFGQRFTRTSFVLGTGRYAIVLMIQTLISFGINDRVHPHFVLTGVVPSGLPSPSWPKLNGDLISELYGEAILMALLAFIEGMAIGKTFARKGNYVRQFNANQELLAQGLANIISSFFMAFPVSPSFSRSTVNHQAGVRTPAGGVVTGLIVIAALYIVTPAFFWIPKATLAAIVIAAVITMVDFHVPRELWRLGREGKQDLVMWCVAFFGVLFLELEVGMSAAIGLNAAMLLYKQARPNYAVLRAKYRDVLVFRVEGPIVFSNVAYLVRLIERIEAHRFYGDGPSDGQDGTDGATGTYQPPSAATNAVGDDDSMVITTADTTAHGLNSNNNTMTLTSEQKQSSTGVTSALDTSVVSSRGSGRATGSFYGRSLNGDAPIVTSRKPPPSISPSASLNASQIQSAVAVVVNSSNNASIAGSPQMGPYTPVAATGPLASSIAIPSSKASRSSHIRGLPPPILGSPLDLGIGSMGSPSISGNGNNGSASDNGSGSGAYGSNSASPRNTAPASINEHSMTRQTSALSAGSPIFPAPPGLMVSPAYGPTGTPGTMAYGGGIGDGSFGVGGSGNEHGQWAPEDEDLTLDNYLAADFDNEEEVRMSRERRRLLADRHRRLRSGSIAPVNKSGAMNDVEDALIEPVLTSFLRGVIFDMSSVAFIDTTAIKALKELIHGWHQRDKRVVTHFASVHASVRPFLMRGLDLTRKQVHASVAQALAAIGAPQGLFDDQAHGGSLHASPVPNRSRTTISGVEQTAQPGGAVVTMTHIDDVSVSFSDRAAGPLVFDGAASTPSSSSHIAVPQRSPNRPHRGGHQIVGSHIEEASNSLI